jgi:hypothetical protein
MCAHPLHTALRAGGDALRQAIDSLSHHPLSADSLRCAVQQTRQLTAELPLLPTRWPITPRHFRWPRRCPTSVQAALRSTRPCGRSSRINGPWPATSTPVTCCWNQPTTISPTHGHRSPPHRQPQHGSAATDTDATPWRYRESLTRYRDLVRGGSGTPCPGASGTLSDLHQAATASLTVLPAGHRSAPNRSLPAT